MTAPAATPDPAELVTAYTPLAMKLARRRAVLHPTLTDDLAAEAMLWLTRAATDWRPERGRRIVFATFVHVVVGRGLRRLIERECRQYPAALFARSVRDADGDEVQAVDLAADHRTPAPDDAAERADEVARLPVLLDALTPERRELLARYYGDEVTSVRLAAETGVSAQAVREAVARSLAKIKTAAG